MLDPCFVTILNNQLKDTSPSPSDVIALNFRDPSYNAESCSGFHAVEMHFNSNGDLLCLTDFDEQRQALASVACHLASDGLLLLDIVNPLALEIQGSKGALVGDAAVEGGRWQKMSLGWPEVVIGGGTPNIQKNIIAERILGLPKD